MEERLQNIEQKNIHKSNRKALIFIKCSSHIKHNIPNTIIHENALYKK